MAFLNGVASSAQAVMLVASILTLLGVIIWVRTLPIVRGTTLLAAWLWSLAALVAIPSVELGIVYYNLSPEFSAPLRNIAAILTLCPTLSILGARRPLNRPWQLIVLSFWVVLTFPALQTLVLPNASLHHFEIDKFRLCLLLVLTIACGINYTRTRFWPNAALVTLSQFVLFAPLITKLPNTASITLGGFSGLIIAISLVTLGFPRETMVTDALDRRWLNFRNLFGAVWALRVADQFNKISARKQWSVCLRWNGLVWKEPENSQALTSPVNKAMRSLLWRFEDNRS